MGRHRRRRHVTIEQCIVVFLFGLVVVLLIVANVYNTETKTETDTKNAVPTTITTTTVTDLEAIEKMKEALDERRRQPTGSTTSDSGESWWTRSTETSRESATP